MSVRRGILLLVFTLSSLVSSVAALPSAAAAPARRGHDARTLFERAVNSLRQGQFAEARDLLNQSLVLEERPGTAYNLAIAYRGTGESLRAIEILRELAAGHYGEIDAEQRREVAALLRSVEREVATIEIGVRGAARVELRIDGRLVGELAQGESRAFRVDGGERLIAASAPDHVPAERRVRVERGKRARVAFALTPTREARFGHLVVIAPSPGDSVEIQGYPAARGRIEQDVPPGRYRVRLLGEDGAREATVTVRARSVVRHQFDAVRERTIWQSPVFWASAAGAVAAVTVGVLLLAGPPREEPLSDPEFGVTEALRPR